MKVIPAIDLIDGRPVRLSEGDYKRKTDYNRDALDVAKAFEDGGLERLHLVDLDAAAGRGNNLAILDKIASRTSLTIDFGGGIRSRTSLISAFESGASYVNVGSAAFKKPGEVLSWNSEWPGRIILSADLKDGKVAVSGWMEETAADGVEFISRFLASGVKEAVVTDISRDGMLSGPAIELYKMILSKLPALHLVASGGVSSVSDLLELKKAGLFAAIVGKAYYENRITIEEMKEAECSQDE
ncbi:MAG: 1-(5-phosphoribosyl)-5-[(5-phosphoribosylamino)methylideneamino]imidazole-4-carboxamide isomerase [Spirochaetes bacterium]|uniref:1-(5-phosphoribosyl)-5-[(5-phosphoribosylamino)methylideneamino] imidazole-4-carboxamide isomerase n=1 Tax=Candidatus Ornithospirochaeta stercoripullorum TaxID=2840899 RepID=A0A9D9H2B0_9SPIO|nr:1-(5-phosphoribosyl)-5-[(5-phosphoribosylamino)methylideneamino]imidazole-4-carboxamide isomerase [Candidatus Ornithospirochaeta stercoripullorum]